MISVHDGGIIKWGTCEDKGGFHESVEQWIPRTEAPTFPRNATEMPILRSHPRPTETETLRGRGLCSWWF